MAEIITDYEKLSERSNEIDTTKQNVKMREIVLALKKTIRENKLLGLAAPQIGYNARIVVINYSGNLVTYINPVIYDAKGLTLSRENCPSIPGKQYIRLRNPEVSVTYITPLGKIKSEKFIGAASCIMQYLCDMIDGVLLSDIGMEIDDAWDTFTEEEKNDLIDCYLESIDLKRKHTHEEIENDPSLKEIDDGIKFMTALQKGEVKLVPATIHIDNADEINEQIEKAKEEKKEDAGD